MTEVEIKRGGVTIHKGSRDTPLGGFTPEEELLLLSVRPHVDAEGAARVSALLGGYIDWEHVIRLADLHRVLSILYLRLRSVSPQACPPSVMAVLEERFHKSVKSNLHLSAELRKIVKLCIAREIPVLALKGVALAHELRGSVALRDRGDLDLLVQKRDVWRVKELLQSIGYRPVRQTSKLAQSSKLAEELLLRSNCAYEFTNENATVFVDVHWEVVPKNLFSAPDPADLLRRAQSISLQGETVRIPSPEDLLIISCLNGSKQGWRSLLGITDIATIIEAYTYLDWQQLALEADALHCRRTVSIGLLLANDLLGVALPDTIAGRMRVDQSAVDIARQVQEQLFGETDIELEGIELMRAILPLKERLRDKARTLSWFFCMPAPADYAALPLPAALVGLYWVVRPVRLLLKYSLRLPNSD